MTVAPNDGKDPVPDAWATPETTRTVVTTLAFRKAVDELLRFAYAAKSLGLLSWSFGIVFAGLAIGLRFWQTTDMAEPEFISCLVFASLLVFGGYCLYVLESRGYVKLVSEFAVHKPDGPHGPMPPVPSDPPRPAIAGSADAVNGASAASGATESAPVA